MLSTSACIRMPLAEWICIQSSPYVRWLPAAPACPGLVLAFSQPPASLWGLKGLWRLSHRCFLMSLPPASQQKEEDPSAAAHRGLWGFDTPSSWDPPHPADPRNENLCKGSVAGWTEVRLELSRILARMLVTKYAAKSILAPFGQHTAPFLSYSIPIIFLSPYLHYHLSFQADLELKSF